MCFLIRRRASSNNKHLLQPAALAPVQDTKTAGGETVYSYFCRKRRSAPILKSQLSQTCCFTQVAEQLVMITSEDMLSRQPAKCRIELNIKLRCLTAWHDCICGHAEETTAQRGIPVRHNVRTKLVNVGDRPFKVIGTKLRCRLTWPKCSGAVATFKLICSHGR